MPLPGRPARRVVVAVAFAQSTILVKHVISARFDTMQPNPHTCLPTLVRPRVSRRLWTGFAIQLILGSRRIYNAITIEKMMREKVLG